MTKLTTRIALIGWSLRQRLPACVLVLALVLSALFACGAEPAADTDEKPGAGLHVPSSWQTARKATGHEIHVSKAKIACSKCHDLSQNQVTAPKPGVCTACHEKEARIEHASALASQRFGPNTPSDCTPCHGFSTPDSTTRTPGPWACLRCHSEKQGKLLAVTTHREGTCQGCHTPHDKPQVAPGECSKCHEKVHTWHAVPGRTLRAACVDCHTNQHAPAVDAKTTCVECHSSRQPLIPKTALFAGGHAACRDCHAPHSERVAVDCRSCHAHKLVLGQAASSARGSTLTTPLASPLPAPSSRGADGHGPCTNCHSPHGVRGSASAACTRCHTRQSPDHPVVGAADGCVSCHEPHPASREADAPRACSSCHDRAHDDQSFHSGAVACTACHAPHDFRLAGLGSALCMRCHSQEVTFTRSNAGHSDCRGCHSGVPHDVDTKPSACGQCHASEQSRVRPEHAACRSCHEPHGGTQQTACSSCHSAEQQSAPRGHERCVGCHEPHQGALVSGFACTHCHAEKKNALHAALPGGCTNCHRAHGPQGHVEPPSCSSCHEKPDLPGLHAETHHAECRTCHAPHDQRSKAQRLACTSCHKDRQNHFPNAPTCSACHLFRK